MTMYAQWQVHVPEDRHFWYFHLKYKTKEITECSFDQQRKDQISFLKINLYQDIAMWLFATKLICKTNACIKQQQTIDISSGISVTTYTISARRRPVVTSQRANLLASVFQMCCIWNLILCQHQFSIDGDWARWSSVTTFSSSQRWSMASWNRLLISFFSATDLGCFVSEISTTTKLKLPSTSLLFWLWTRLLILAHTSGLRLCTDADKIRCLCGCTEYKETEPTDNAGIESRTRS